MKIAGPIARRTAILDGWRFARRELVLDQDPSLFSGD